MQGKALEVIGRKENRMEIFLNNWSKLYCFPPGLSNLLYKLLPINEYFLLTLFSFAMTGLKDLLSKLKKLQEKLRGTYVTAPMLTH